MPPLSPISLDEHLARVSGEAIRAAVLLSAARSPRFAYQYELRLAESAVQRAGRWMQMGIHMAGLASLCAVLEEARRPDLVNLPSLFRRLDDAAERRQLAVKRGIETNVVYERIRRIRERYQRKVKPNVEEVKSIRDNVIAHHGRNDPMTTTYGRVSRLAERTLVVVEELHKLNTGDCAHLRDTLRDIRWESAALWSKGIDGKWDDQTIVAIEADRL